MMIWDTINWELFHFLRPKWLWGLLPIGMASLFHLGYVRSRFGWTHDIAPHLRPFVIRPGNETVRYVFQLYMWVAVSLAVVGAAGPVWETIQVPGKTLQNPVVMVLDVSPSMQSRDLTPNRLDRAKFKIRDFLAQKPRAQVGLVVFSGSAHMVIPPTADFRILESQLENISPSTMPVSGSNVVAGLDLAQAILAGSPAPGQILLYTDESSLVLFQWANQLAMNTETKLYIMPIGTAKGGKVPRTKYTYYTEKGRPVISKLDTAILQQIAPLDHVTVIPFTIDSTDNTHLFNEIEKDLLFTTKAQTKEDEWVDNGWWLLLPFAFGMLWLFRKGFVMYVFILGLHSCDTPLSTYFQTADYRAQQAMNNGNYADAAEWFTTPMNKGVAYFYAGNYAQAIRYLSQDSSAQAKYNMGVVYVAMEDYASAGMAFEAAATQDTSLVFARQNALVVQRWLQQSDTNVRALTATEESGKEAQNIQNKDQEDLGGGGQEATKKDMEQERKEETVTTDTRKAKELDELPDEFEDAPPTKQKVLMQKVNDDPALFLKRKFKMQYKKNPPAKPEKPW